METILAFLAGLFLSPTALLVLVCIGIILEYAEWTGLATFVGVIAAISAFFFFNVPLQTLGLIAIAYLAIGICWSFWRYRVYVNKKVDELVRSKSDVPGYVVDRWSPSESIAKITAWIIIWPFSMIENITSDLIRFVETLIRDVFKKIYNSIYNSAVARIPNKKEKQ